MLLTELFIQPVEYRITQNALNNYQAEFQIDGYYYIAAAMKDTVWPNETPLPNHFDKVWEIGFSTFEAETDEEFTEITNRGHAPTLFATVIAFVKDAVNTKNIKAIKIVAWNHQPSRVKLYQRIVNTLTRKYGWTAIDQGIEKGMHVWYTYKE